MTKTINIISDIVKHQFVKEVKNAGMFLVQMDSTQNISAHDQCAIVLRYDIGDRAKERLARQVNGDNSKRKMLAHLATKFNCKDRPDTGTVH